MRSSYIKNNYGVIFNALILIHKPRLVVELGSLDGYSTYHIADSLKFNKEKENINSEFFSYDLWGDYQYKHGNYSEVKKMLEQNKVDGYVTLRKGNAFDVHNEFLDGSIELLHVDISNDGEKLINILMLWGRKLSKRGIILFEGGSHERDNIEWMVKYNFPKIKPALESLKGWEYKVLLPYPSMTLLSKKDVI